MHTLRYFLIELPNDLEKNEPFFYEKDVLDHAVQRFTTDFEPFLDEDNYFEILMVITSRNDLVLARSRYSRGRFDGVLDAFQRLPRAWRWPVVRTLTLTSWLDCLGWPFDWFRARLGLDGWPHTINKVCPDPDAFERAIRDYNRTVRHSSERFGSPRKIRSYRAFHHLFGFVSEWRRPDLYRYAGFDLTTEPTGEWIVLVTDIHV